MSFTFASKLDPMNVMAGRMFIWKSRSSRLSMLRPVSFAANLHSHTTSFGAWLEVQRKEIGLLVDCFIFEFNLLEGFKEVQEEEKKRLVGNVFTSVASKYDIMNDLMSGGMHRLWKDRLVSKLHLFPGIKHLDVAGGTGDIAFRILDSLSKRRRRYVQDVTADDVHEDSQIFVYDINPHMLDVGRKRAMDKGVGKDKSLVWVEGDAEALTFEDNSIDSYTIAFGIRNVTHIDTALSEAFRVLKKGGRFLCLELSHVNAPIFKKVYDLYSFSIVPALGQVVTGDRDSYQYLVESIRKFPSQEKFASIISEAGFEKVQYENLLFGVVAIHSAFKL